MNHTLSDWIPVDDGKYSGQRDVPISPRGLLIEMQLSPYDVPEHVRGDYVESQRKFVIEFKYIDSEPTREVRLDSHVHADVGTRSGRVYVLTIDVDSMDVSSVALKIDEKSDVHDSAIESFKKLSKLGAGDRSLKKNTNNYTVASRILSDYWGVLSKEAARDLLPAY